MKIVKEDIFNCSENIIVHQTNCQGVMGHGIALQVKQKYPDVFKGYYHYCKTNKIEDILGTALICECSDGKYIANIFGQVNYGKGLQTDYKALENGFKEVRDFAFEKSLSIAIPEKIGCGLAHGDWNIVLPIIQEIFKDMPYTIYSLNKTSSEYEEENVKNS